MGISMEENELPEEKTKVINGVTLSNIEISKIAMICDYLVLDRYNDISSFLRFEKCFGPLLSKEDPQLLIDAFQEICGPKRKYINFSRLILAYIKWKSNSSRNENFNKFMKIVFNDMIKTEKEVIGKLEEGTRIFSTRNTRGRKVISKFGVFTDSLKNTIQGFNIQYDDFFDSTLCAKKKENEDKNITLEMNFLPNGKTILDRDGISHIAGKFSAAKKLIKFLIFKCRSGKTFYIGDNTENDEEQIQLFMFGTSSCQLKTLRIETINDKLAYLEPKFQPSMRVNVKIVPFDNIDEKYINENIVNNRLIFEENELQNIPDEQLDLSTLLIPCINDDAFITDKKTLVEPISGKDIKEFYKSYLERQKESMGENSEDQQKNELKNKLLDETVKRVALLNYYIKKFNRKENFVVLNNNNKQDEERVKMDKYLVKIKIFKRKMNAKMKLNQLELEEMNKGKEEYNEKMEGFEQEEDWPDLDKKENIEIEENKEDKKDGNNKEEEIIEIKIEAPEVKNEEEKNILEEKKIEERKEEKNKIEINEKLNIDSGDVKEIILEEDEPEKKNIKLRGGRPKKLNNKRKKDENAQDEDKKEEIEDKKVEEGEDKKEEGEDKKEEKIEIIQAENEKEEGEDKKEEKIEIIQTENEKEEGEDKKEEKIEIIQAENEKEKGENKNEEVEDKKEEKIEIIQAENEKEKGEDKKEEKIEIIQAENEKEKGEDKKEEKIEIIQAENEKEKGENKNEEVEDKKEEKIEIIQAEYEKKEGEDKKEEIIEDKKEEKEEDNKNKIDNIEEKKEVIIQNKIEVIEEKIEEVNQDILEEKKEEDNQNKIDITEEKKEEANHNKKKKEEININITNEEKKEEININITSDKKTEDKEGKEEDNLVNYESDKIKDDVKDDVKDEDKLLRKEEAESKKKSGCVNCGII